jgi:hypothetical protein
MSQPSSFVGSFDLSSQTGVAAVLAAIRASQLSPAEKNELRDLVFSYTNGGGDASVRIALEQKLSAHAIAPVVLQRGGVAAPTLEFGSYRPTPNFKAPAVAATPIPPANAVPPTPAPATPPPITAAAPGVATPLPSVSIPVVPTPPAPVYAAPAPVTPQPVPPAPAPVSVPPVQPVPSAPAAVQPSSSQYPTSQSEAAYLERIRQIKTAVNSKVGNPVNLVDINNAVGREYMNALLDAMKKLGSGAISEMEPAMARLETAFSAVEVAIKEHEGKSSVPVAASAPVQSSEPAPAASSPVASVPVSEVVPPTSPVPPVPPIPQPLVVEQQPEPVLEREVPSRPVVSESDTVPGSNRIPLREVPLPSRTTEEPVVQTQADVVKPEPASADDSGPSGCESAPTPAIPTPPPSLATEKKLLSPNDLKDASQVETGQSGDPLFTKEVDDGLEQLLADWSLFKKSGLFGTGPKGREHPLYKKISGLQVPLLLAGRFDGANQEIRQSITDYMNGWRYEQGIIYQPGETFERYLRRVIRHILDLQKKRRGA